MLCQMKMLSIILQTIICLDALFSASNTVYTSSALVVDGSSTKSKGWAESD